MKKLVGCLGGPELVNYDDTRYYSRPNGGGLLRIANHRGSADEFAVRKEWFGNYGIVFLFPNSWKRFRKDRRVDYREEVYMP